MVWALQLPSPYIPSHIMLLIVYKNNCSGVQVLRSAFCIDDRFFFGHPQYRFISRELCQLKYCAVLYKHQQPAQSYPTNKVMREKISTYLSFYVGIIRKKNWKGMYLYFVQVQVYGKVETSFVRAYRYNCEYCVVAFLIFLPICMTLGLGDVKFFVHSLFRENNTKYLSRYEQVQVRYIICIITPR